MNSSNSAHDNERQLFAMRRTANYLTRPFSHDAVQDTYNEWPNTFRLTLTEEAKAALWFAAGCIRQHCSSVYGDDDQHKQALAVLDRLLASWDNE